MLYRLALDCCRFGIFLLAVKIYDLRFCCNNGFGIFLLVTVKTYGFCCKSKIWNAFSLLNFGGDLLNIWIPFAGVVQSCFVGFETKKERVKLIWGLSSPTIRQTTNSICWSWSISWPRAKVFTYKFSYFSILFCIRDVKF